MKQYRFIAAFALLMACVGAFAAPMQVNTEGVRATYSYVAADYAPAAGATDVVVLTGSSSKVIRINRIQITADSTAPSVIDLYVFKRSAANTGGTSTNPYAVKHDSANTTASGVVTLYSANPSALGAGWLIRADHYALPAASSTGYPGAPWFEDFGVRNDQPIILRNANESIAISLNGQTLPAGLNLYITISWTEE